MQTDLDLGVTTMFRDATQQNLMQVLKTPQDWQRFDKIRNAARAAEWREKTSFADNKPDLLTEALKDVINEAGSRKYEYPTPYGTDRFGRSANEAEARRRVEHAHQNRLTKIREDEGFAYARLKQDIRTREQNRDIPRQEFNRVTDRRSGPDRRMPGPER